MARKTSRRRQQTQQRPRRPATANPTAAPARSAAAQRPVGGDQAAVRAVEMSLAPGAPSRRGARVVLDSADPAIPLDRVPYFVADLRQLGFVAAAMVVLLVLGALFVVPLIIH